MFSSASMSLPAVLLAAILAAVFVHPAQATSAPEPASRHSLQGISDITADSILAGMNEYRAKHLLEPLRSELRLTSAAEDRMRDMEDLGYWGHQSPEGRSPFFWVRYRSYRFTMVGENLARGYETASVLMDSWMDSPGHRDNILEVQYRDVGIAIIDGATTGRYPGRSVVVLFGRE
jgi:uncharacterized protein YkwD